jgi:alpha-L-rhamnosidase
LYSVKNGATTIWERLNSFTLENGFGGNNSMNSFNHYSFGAVAAWMNSYSLGIQRDEKSPGFKHFILQPTPDPTGEMKYAKGHYDSVYGRIESAWKTTPIGWEFETTIPPNTSAIWILEEANQWEVLEHSKGEQKPLLGYKSKKVGSNLLTTLPSGKYHFKITKKK